mmetsp:Transcript_101162/g.274931  ORF Transcript_101162/g.274931 Transcript_101162/m.274931 type:complete len:571 (-) Transcript_101162:584-2296(-)
MRTPGDAPLLREVAVAVQDAGPLGCGGPRLRLHLLPRIGQHGPNGHQLPLRGGGGLEDPAEALLEGLRFGQSGQGALQRGLVVRLALALAAPAGEGLLHLPDRAAAGGAGARRRLLALALALALALGRGPAHQRRGEAAPGATDDLAVGELAQGLLAPHGDAASRPADTPEADVVVAEHPLVARVHADVARAGAGQELLHGRLVLGVAVGDQRLARRRRVDVRDRLAHPIDHQHRQQGPEDLVPEDVLLHGRLQNGRHGQRHGGVHGDVGPRQGWHLFAVGLEEHRLDALVLPPVVQGHAPRIAQLLQGGLELLHEDVPRLAVHEHVVVRAAELAAEGLLRDEDLLHHLVHDAVAEALVDEDGALPPQLQRDRREVPRRPGGDQLSYLAAAGETQVVWRLVDEPLDRVPRALLHPHEAVQVLLAQAPQQRRDRGRRLGGLDHYVVASGQHPESRDRCKEGGGVPGRDHEASALRLVVRVEVGLHPHLEHVRGGVPQLLGLHPGWHEGLVELGGAHQHPRGAVEAARGDAVGGLCGGEFVDVLREHLEGLLERSHPRLGRVQRLPLCPQVL